MILFRSYLVCAIFTLHLFCIIGHPIDDSSLKLESNKNDQLFLKKISSQELDGSSEHVDKFLQDISRDVSVELDNTSSSDNSLFWMNNIYLIGIFNASFVELGDLLFRKNLKTKTSKENECYTLEVKSTKKNIQEHFDEVGNMEKSTFVLNPSTENNLKMTYHYPSKTKV